MTRDRATLLEGLIWFLAGLGIIALFAHVAIGQTNMGPIRIPQINSNLYVGQSGYPTIQSAITFACRQTNPSFAVVILPGISPSDTPAQATGGCTGTYIADLRLIPMIYYAWNGSAYVVTGYVGTISQTPNLLMGDNHGNAIDSTIAASNVPLLNAATNTFTGIQVGHMFASTGGENATPIPGTATLQSPTSVDEGMLAAFGKTATQPAGVVLVGLNNTGSISNNYLACNPITPTTFGCIVTANTLTVTGDVVGHAIAATGGEATPIAGSATLQSPGSVDEGMLAAFGKTATQPAGIVLTGLNSTSTMSQNYLACNPATPTTFACIVTADTTTFSGEIDASTGNISGSRICTLANPCTSTPETFPAAGAAVSTGTGWGASIPTATLATISGGNTLVPAITQSSLTTYAGGTFGTAATLSAAALPTLAGNPNIFTGAQFVFNPSLAAGTSLYGFGVGLSNTANGALLFGYHNTGTPGTNYGVMQVAGGTEIDIGQGGTLTSNGSQFCQQNGTGCPHIGILIPFSIPARAWASSTGYIAGAAPEVSTSSNGTSNTSPITCTPTSFYIHTLATNTIPSSEPVTISLFNTTQGVSIVSTTMSWGGTLASSHLTVPITGAVPINAGDLFAMTIVTPAFATPPPSTALGATLYCVQ